MKNYTSNQRTIFVHMIRPIKGHSDALVSGQLSRLLYELPAISLRELLYSHSTRRFVESRHDSFSRRKVSNNSEIGIEWLRTFHCHPRKFYRAYKTTVEGKKASKLELRLAVFIGAILSHCFFKPAISLMTNSLTFSRQL